MTELGNAAAETGPGGPRSTGFTTRGTVRRVSSYADGLRKWVQPAGPKEGQDPVRVSRVFVAMRRGVLAASPATLGLVPSERLPRVWAVLADLDVGPEVLTVACVADGTTSLYAGGGGAILGAGARSAVAAVAGQLLETAERVLDALPAADRIALPEAGSVAFLVLTWEGMRRLEVPEAVALDSKAGPPHELYVATRDVVAELRLADVARATLAPK